MASIVVQNIQVGNNDNVLFYEGSTIIQSVSRIAPNATPYILRDGLNIVIINRNPGNDLQLSNGSKANDHLIFSTQYVTNIGARIYTPVNQAANNSGDLNLQRAKEIYSDLVNNIFKGCCDCGGGNECSLQYQYDSDIETGQFYTISGKLLMSMDSYNGVDLSGLLHHLPNGSWLWFTKESDPTIYYVYEISNYTVISGLATWDYTLIDSQGAIAESDIFCLSIQAALGTGGGGSQGWQQTLDVDPDVDTDNIIGGGGFGIIWNLFKTWLVTATTSIISRVTSGSNVSESGNDTSEAYLKYTKSGVVIGVWAGASKLRIITTNINTAAAANGYPLLLTSTIDGDSDFAQLDTVGIKNLAVTQAKLAEATGFVTVGGASFNAVDSFIYYFGAPFQNIAPTNTADRRRTYVSTARTITAINLQAFTTVAASGESITVVIRVNNTTDYPVSSSWTWNAGANSWNNLAVTGLSIALAANDYYEIKMTMPVFATNPTGVSMGGSVELK